MTIISFIAINFGAIYRTTKSSYRDSPIPNDPKFISSGLPVSKSNATTFVWIRACHNLVLKVIMQIQLYQDDETQT